MAEAIVEYYHCTAKNGHGSLVRNEDCLTDLEPQGCASQADCELCNAGVQYFSFELFSARGSITGRCCRKCFPHLLKAMSQDGRKDLAQDKTEPESSHPQAQHRSV